MKSLRAGMTAEFEAAANSNKYSRPVRILHWISALIILWATISGVALGLFTIPETIKHPIVAFNVATTTLFMPLFFLRVLYAVFGTRPPHLRISKRNARIAKLVHIALYAVTATALCSGVLMMSRDIDLYGVATLPHPLHDARLNALFFVIHRCACAILAALIVLHIAAVIRHQRRGTDVIARML